MTTFDPGRVSAVIFDIGGVFTYPTFHPVRHTLSAWGIDHPDDEPFLRAHHAGVHALTLARRDRGVSGHSEDYWYTYDHAYGAKLGVGEERMAELRTSIRTDWDWVHLDNVAAFARLVKSGLPTALVSNNDGTAAEQMQDLGICQIGPGPLPSVATIVDSAIVGILKPDPAIFAPALEALDVEPGRALYIGDTVYADVDGALAAGMQVVQLDPFDDHADFGHARLPDVAAVEAALAERLFAD
ncbi:MAG: HAD hydrolase-like protein [Acidimicrobiia bacterium]|nr:HAD hydrolase-like protein [Acidimicrobiia bacterium]